MSRRKTQHIKDTNVLIEFRRIGKKLLEQAAQAPAAPASPTPSAPTPPPTTTTTTAKKMAVKDIEALSDCSKINSSKIVGNKGKFEQDGYNIMTADGKPYCKDLKTKKS
jgi:hypothetical protein